MYPCTAWQCPKKTRRLRSFDTRCRQKMLMTTEAQLPPCVVAFTGPVIKRRIANPAQNAWVSFYMHRVPRPHSLHVCKLRPLNCPLFLFCIDRDMVTIWTWRSLKFDKMRAMMAVLPPETSCSTSTKARIFETRSLDRWYAKIWYPISSYDHIRGCKPGGICWISPLGVKFST